MSSCVLGLASAVMSSCVLGLARVLVAYHGVPSPQNGCAALLLRVDDVVDVLSSDDDFWWEVCAITHTHTHTYCSTGVHTF